MSHDTKKIKAVTQKTEIEHYREQYVATGRDMLADPSPENLKKHNDAQKKLQEVEDLYRQGYRLLLERLKKFKSRVLQRL